MEVDKATTTWECLDYAHLKVRVPIELSKWVRTREPTRLTTSSGRIGLNFFYKFQYGLIFDLAHLELGSSRLNPWWAWLAHQSADKRVTQVFFIKLGFTFGSCYVFFNQQINNLYFFYFSLYFDCIKVYLDFN